MFVKIGINTIRVKKKKKKSLTSEKMSCINSKDSNKSQCIRKPLRNIIVGKLPEVGAIIAPQTS